jgi:taurine dioxygenase
MTIEISSMPGAVGALVDEGDALQLQDLSPADAEALRNAFASHSVTLIRGASLDPQSHLALTRVLGDPDIHPVESIRLPGQPEIIEIAHTPETIAEGSTPGSPEELVGYLDWHADLMYTPSPSRGALLRALEIPEEGGETAFLDTTLAYEALDESMKRDLIGKKAVYRFRGNLFRARSRTVDDEQFSEVGHPLLHFVPETRKIALNVSSAAIRIDGLAGAESELLLSELHQHMVQERFIYVHRWQVGDLIILNNKRTLHSAFGHKRKYTRLLHRTTLKGGPLEPLAA